MSAAAPPVRLWYLSPGVYAPRAVTEGGLQRLPAVTPELVRAATAALDAAASQVAELSVVEIIASIDAVLQCWRDPADPHRAALLEHGPTLTGYSRPLLQHAIDAMLARFDASGLRRLLAEELGDPAALDGFVECRRGTWRRARGTGRQFQVLAGGVPSVPVFSLICALLLKSPVLAKPSEHDPLFPSVFAQALARVEPRLAGALAVLPWPGGSVELEQAAMEGACAVVAYGSDATIGHLRRRAPAAARFVGYGHRLSLAGVSRETLGVAEAASTARRLAWDVALFDQQGCLSPQFAAVERGGAVSPRAFAEHVAAALEALGSEIPRGALTAAEAASIQSLRELARFQAAAGAGVTLWHSRDSTDWTVIFRPDAESLQTHRNRVLTIVPVDDLEHELPRLCKGRPISTIGLAMPRARLLRAATAVSAVATRVCPLGTMGEPPITWRHDGQTNLGPLLTWVDLEIG